LQQKSNFDKNYNCGQSNEKAVLLQGEPRYATVNIDTYRILQAVNNGTFNNNNKFVERHG